MKKTGAEAGLRRGKDIEMLAGIFSKCLNAFGAGINLLGLTARKNRYPLDIGAEFTLGCRHRTAAIVPVHGLFTAQFTFCHFFIASLNFIRTATRRVIDKEHITPKRPFLQASWDYNRAILTHNPDFDKDRNNRLMGIIRA